MSKKMISMEDSRGILKLSDVLETVTEPTFKIDYGSEFSKKVSFSAEGMKAILTQS